ncbi:MAG: tetratricopeptide repeat protein [Rhodocyclaceae bacterium]|nr:tetratricopeptide repeat protein [Rhodocyclaceae bacterium]
MKQPADKRRDRRPLALLLTVAGVTLGGLLVARYDDIAAGVQSLRQRGHAEMQRRGELEQRFRQGVVMLHARRYDEAAKAFHRVLQLAPRLPEAHVNMGFSLVGLAQWPAAHDFFATAIELNPEQANAYYGLAVALEGLEDLPGAIGAMRTYVHRSGPEDPFRRKAEAAIWEWRARLEQARPQIEVPANASPARPPTGAPGSSSGSTDGKDPG